MLAASGPRDPADRFDAEDRSASNGFDSTRRTGRNDDDISRRENDRFVVYGDLQETGNDRIRPLPVVDPGGDNRSPWIRSGKRIVAERREFLLQRSLSKRTIAPLIPPFDSQQQPRGVPVFHGRSLRGRLR
jgi:hypothetical protein